jgi:hypothetical protein
MRTHKETLNQRSLVSGSRADLRLALIMCAVSLLTFGLLVGVYEILF